MSDYDIEIHRRQKIGVAGATKTEIWAEINDKLTGKTITKLIWWEDDEGAFHDETPDLPVEIRDQIDNAWIEKCRKW
jgi:hypothetical protein